VRLKLKLGRPSQHRMAKILHSDLVLPAGRESKEACLFPLEGGRPTICNFLFFNCNFYFSIFNF
jgi:hypothetical protein